MVKSSMDDYVRSIIGIGIAFGGLGTIIAAWAFRSVADAQAISTGMTALVGGVLGYYFGAKGVDAAQANAAEQANLKGKTDNAAANYQKRVRDLIQHQKGAHAELFLAPKDQRAKDPKTASIDATVSELETLDWTSFLPHD